MRKKNDTLNLNLPQGSRKDRALVAQHGSRWIVGRDENFIYFFIIMVRVLPNSKSCLALAMAVRDPPTRHFFPQPVEAGLETIPGEPIRLEDLHAILPPALVEIKQLR